MSSRTCPFCGQQFIPSVYHPDQTICGDKRCQTRRRTEYHKRKLEDDAEYRESCRDSQRLWRERNPDYMRTYRQARAELRDSRLEELLRCVKNNPALEIRRCPAAAWIVVPKGTRAKNIVASAQTIVFEVSSRSQSCLEAGKNILLAVPDPAAYK
jgi:hypothetical protein